MRFPQDGSQSLMIATPTKEHEILITNSLQLELKLLSGKQAVSRRIAEREAAGATALIAGHRLRAGRWDHQPCNKN